ncbi:MAG: S26 family signal peptidase [Succinivibrionaceae bacterium]|nr:S26 family signal peptidase [Succinivibrionaceae bacterium]
MAEKFGHDKSYFIRSLAVPYGKYFLTGTNDRSLDSRYTGTVREELCEGRAFPLF